MLDNLNYYYLCGEVSFFIKPDKELKSLFFSGQSVKYSGAYFNLVSSLCLLLYLFKYLLAFSFLFIYTHTFIFIENLFFFLYRLILLRHLQLSISWVYHFKSCSQKFTIICFVLSNSKSKRFCYKLTATHLMVYTNFS